MDDDDDGGGDDEDDDDEDGGGDDEDDDDGATQVSYTEGSLDEGEGRIMRAGRRRGGGGGGGAVGRRVDDEEGAGELEPPRALPVTNQLERDKAGWEGDQSEVMSDWKSSEIVSEGQLGKEEKEEEQQQQLGRLEDAIFTVDAWCGLDCGEGTCHQVKSQLISKTETGKYVQMKLTKSIQNLLNATILTPPAH